MKQDMIAVSATAKEFIVALCASYPEQPGKTKAHDLTQREAVDAIISFVEVNREGCKVETDDEGNENLVSVDLLDLEVKRTLALRAATVRANSAISKLEAKEKELEELKAILAKLQGETATTEA
jgi:hypothetical protein